MGGGVSYSLEPWTVPEGSGALPKGASHACRVSGTPRGQGGHGAGLAICNRYTVVVVFLGETHLVYKEREKGTPPTL